MCFLWIFFIFCISCLLFFGFCVFRGGIWFFFLWFDCVSARVSSGFLTPPSIPTPSTPPFPTLLLFFCICCFGFFVLILFFFDVFFCLCERYTAL